MIYSRTLSAYAHARYDTLKWREVLTDLSVRGLATDLSYYFNDVRVARRAWQGLETRIGELSHGIERDTSIEVIEQRDMSDATVFANLHDAGPEFLLKVVCDESRISPDDAVGLLAALEALLVEEALAS